MRRIRILLALVLALGARGTARAEGEEAVVVRRLLVLEPGPVPKRSAVNVDPVEAMRVKGTLGEPKAGDTVAYADGTTKAWREIAADEKGAFPKDAALSGGWAFTTVESAEERVAILESSGPSRIHVNGEPRIGDVYGMVEARVPVLLKKGRNDLLFRCGRGWFRARLVPPPAPLYLSIHDATTPDLLRGATGTTWLGLLLTNASVEARTDVRIVASLPGGPERETVVSFVPPLSIFKAAVEVDLPRTLDGERAVVSVRIEGGASIEVPLAVKDPLAKHKRTFVSKIDGSVQYYAVVPAHPTEADKPPLAMVLTLHGASVEATNQAAAYGHKTWAHIVAPTNRRPYGFDWEDWGGLDAMEVLDLAEKELGTNSLRTYLTGHSMGGHGTWILGAQNPGRFAAIAPSAGWRDFFAYGGAPEATKDDPVMAFFDRAANVHRLSLWEPNLAQVPIYVLHGDADDNVPVSEARAMRARLGAFHPNFVYYERPGAGHWWGNECVDWPPLFDFLRRSERDPSSLPSSWVTVETHWGTGGIVREQLRPLEPSRVEIEPSKGQAEFRVRTENVRVLDLPSPWDLSPPPLRIDGQALEWPSADPRVVTRDMDGRWRHSGLEDVHRIGRSGTFKSVFSNRPLLVYATHGTPEENAWSFAKARFDAEQFWYRGNGRLLLVPDDSSLLEPSRLDHNVVIYGHADMNAAWSLLRKTPTAEVRRGYLRLGDRRLDGEGFALLSSSMWIPTAEVGMDWESCTVGIVAGTGVPGMRVLEPAPYFTSGVAYPDWCVLSADLPEKGAAGVLGAGFFAADGSVGTDSAWR